MGMKHYFCSSRQNLLVVYTFQSIPTVENYFTFNLVCIIQEKCVVRQDENHRYFVECSVPGEKGKKRGKGPHSLGENKKRPNSQVSKTYITVFFARKIYILYRPQNPASV